MGPGRAGVWFARIAFLSCVLIHAGCYKPNIVDGGLRCADGGVCPEGFHCAGDGLCREGGAYRSDIDAEEVIGHLQKVEPKQSQLRKDAALVGNAGRQHPVEGADAIGRDDDEAIAEVVNVAHFPATTGDAGDFTLQ